MLLIQSGQEYFHGLQVRSDSKPMSKNEFQWIFKKMVSRLDKWVNIIDKEVR